MIITRRSWDYHSHLFHIPLILCPSIHILLGACHHNNASSDAPSSKREVHKKSTSHQNSIVNTSFELDSEIVHQIRIALSRTPTGKVEDITKHLHCDEACNRIQVSEALVYYLLQNFGDDWKSALGFFIWASSKPGYKHSTRVYNQIVDLLGKMKQMDHMWKLLKEMKLSGLVTTETVSKIMRRLAGAKKWEDAITMFSDLESMGLKKNTETMNILLDTLCKENKVDTAREVFLNLRTYISPDASTFNIFVHGWCKARRIDEAEWTILEMKGYGFYPSDITFSTIIHAYCSQFNFQKAYELLDRMEDEGCPPTIVTYTGVLHKLPCLHDMRAVYELDKRMRSSGLKPDVIYYNCLIKILGCAGKLPQVSHIFDIEMPENGINPDLSTYNTLISVYCHHSLDQNALKILEEMEVASCKPDLLTYTPLLKLYLKRGDIDGRLHSLLIDMVNKHHLSMDSSTYSLLIRGLCRAGKLDWALHLFEDTFIREIPLRKQVCKLLLGEAEERGLHDSVKKINALMMEMK